MATVQREVRKRGLFGKLMKALFIGFNLLMIIWVVGAFKAGGDLPAAASEAEQAGRAIGGVIATSMILGIWAAGDIILGLFVLFTRGERILITEERP